MKEKYKKILLLIGSIFLFIIFGEILTRALIMPPPKSDGDWFVPSDNEILNYELNPGKQGIYEGYPIYVNDFGRRDNHNTNNFQNTKIVAFVGDSFTLGQGVDQNHTLPKQFEDIYNSRYDEKIAALNFALSGYNLEQEIELIKKKVLDYNPDVILVVYHINDIQPRKKLVGEKNEAELPFYLKIYNKILQYSRFASYMKFKSSNILYNLGVTNKGYVNYNHKIYDDKSNLWINFKSELEELGKIKKTSDIPIYYIAYPTLSHFNKYHPYIDIYNKVLLEAAKNDLMAINLFTSFKGKDSTKLRANIYDNHPNKDGHKIAAEYLVKEIGDEIKAIN